MMWHNDLTAEQIAEIAKARTVACPKCKAKIGEPCVVIHNGHPMGHTHHHARIEAADAK